MKLEKASWIAAVLAIPVGIFVWYFKPEDCATFLKGAGKLMWTPFSVAFHWLTHPVTWPAWAFVVLAFAALAVVIGVACLVCWTGSGKGLQVQISPFDYKADEIFGVKWVWDFYYQQLNEASLTAFCPRSSCKNRLTMREDHRRMRVRPDLIGRFSDVPISFTCRNCGFSHEFDSSWLEIKRDVLEEVERRINTGEFRERILGALKPQEPL